MNHEEHRHEEDPEIQAALRNFRESMHGWSEHEFAQPRALKSSPGLAHWRSFANPILAGSIAGILAIAAVAIPVNIHHERELTAQREQIRLQAIETQRKQDAELARKAAEAASYDADDMDFLNDLDSDIAQATPEAMQPLASLMSDTKSR